MKKRYSEFDASEKEKARRRGEPMESGPRSSDISGMGPEALTPDIEKLIGLGESSARKSYYPELQKRLDELELFRLLLNRSSDAVFVLDLDRRELRFANDRTAELFRLDGRDLVGLSVDALPGGELVQAVTECSSSGGPVVRELALDLERHDGGPLVVEVSLNRHFHEAGAYCVAIARDITERKRIEEELRRKREEAVQASRAKTEFLAHMSHEIRTPLNGVLGVLQLLSGSELDEEQREHVEVALKSGRGLLQLLSDILNVSSLEAGAIRLDPRAFDLKAGLRDVVRIFRPQAAIKGVDLRLELDPGLPDRVLGDEGRLRQILFNLLGNALKFTDQGEVVLSVAPDEDQPPMAVFVCRDTGAGIPVGHMDSIFEAFTQASSDTSRLRQGAGLGLVIVKRLAELMGGGIGVANRYADGKVSGAQFTLRLPMAPAGPEAERPAPAGGAGRKPSRPLRILVAEDEAVNRMMAERFLKKLGHEAVTVEDGRRAVERLRDEDFDCVLMDIQMPVMNGVEATRAIRGLAGPKGSAPIVAMTAYAMKGDRERFLEAGMNDYIAKPVEMSELAAILDRVGASLQAFKDSSGA